MNCRMSYVLLDEVETHSKTSRRFNQKLRFLIALLGGVTFSKRIERNKMPNRMSLTITLFLSTVLSISSSADTIATTEDGREVKLYDNGTYEFIRNIDVTKNIDFTDILIDSKNLLNKQVKLIAVGGFRNNSGTKYPNGSVYQSTFTIGPSIKIISKTLAGDSLRGVHQCPLSCTMEITGIVRGQNIIEAIKVIVIDQNGTILK